MAIVFDLDVAAEVQGWGYLNDLVLGWPVINPSMTVISWNVPNYLERTANIILDM